MIHALDVAMGSLAASQAVRPVSQSVTTQVYTVHSITQFGALAHGLIR